MNTPVETFDENGEPHSFNDMPAIVYESDRREWYNHGKLHRINGPAIINSDAEFWYLNGKMHRTDGPAYIDGNGKKQWWMHGNLHRIDGPAEMSPKSDYKWVNGAYVGSKRVPNEFDCEWYVNGRKVTSRAIEFYEENNLDPAIPLSKNMSMLFKLTVV